MPHELCVELLLHPFMWNMQFSWNSCYTRSCETCNFHGTLATLFHVKHAIFMELLLHSFMWNMQFSWNSCYTRSCETCNFHGTLAILVRVKHAIFMELLLYSFVWNMQFSWNSCYTRSCETCNVSGGKDLAKPGWNKARLVLLMCSLWPVLKVCPRLERPPKSRRIPVGAGLASEDEEGISRTQTATPNSFFGLCFSLLSVYLVMFMFIMFVFILIKYTTLWNRPHRPPIIYIYIYIYKHAM